MNRYRIKQIVRRNLRRRTKAVDQKTIDDLGKFHNELAEFNGELGLALMHFGNLKNSRSLNLIERDTDIVLQEPINRMLADLRTLRASIDTVTQTMQSIAKILIP